MATKGKKLTELVGRNIRRRRLEMGLTQGQVAEALSVEVETVSRYERGVLSPSLPQLGRLADVLGTPAHQLLQNTSAPVEATADGLAHRMASLPPDSQAFVTEFIRAYIGLHGEAAGSKKPAKKATGGRAKRGTA